MVTVGFKKAQGKGIYKAVVAEQTLTGTYSTGGKEIDLSEYLDTVEVAFAQDSYSGYVAHVATGSYSGAAFKVKLLYWTSGGDATAYGLSEVSDGAAISGTVITVFAVGT
ncbi:MAG: hypothetical protein ACTSV7_06760 [Candidatus Baldrarchaeia archaeon]